MLGNQYSRRFFERLKPSLKNHSEEQLLTENTWSIVLFVLNGFVFLLLGMNIPSAMFEIISTPDIGNWLAFKYVIVIGLAILAIRFGWSILSGAYRYYLLRQVLFFFY